MNRRRMLAACVGAAAAGCVGYADEDGPPDGETLLAEAIETRRGLESLAARRIVSIETPETDRERVERIHRCPPAAQRIEVLESTDPTIAEGAVTVTNRTTTWEYDPTAGVVDERFHPTKVDADRTLAVLESLQAEARVVREGTESVDGREAHVLETRPPVDDLEPRVDLVVGDTTYVIPLGSLDDLEELDAVRTVWIDDEYRYPVRERHALVGDDEQPRHEVTVTYEDLELDADLEPSRFEYEPPADATVVSDGPEPEGVFERRDAAAAVAPYDLPEPDVPEPFVLDRIVVVEKGDGFGTTTKLWYDDPTVVARELYVAVRTNRRFEPDALEKTDLEFEGNPVYRRDGRIESLFWDCGELNYEVTCLTGDEPLGVVAASIGCP